MLILCLNSNKSIEVSNLISVENKLLEKMFFFNLKVLTMSEGLCPGFGQDRVNFHQNPGRGTAVRADPI